MSRRNKIIMIVLAIIGVMLSLFLINRSRQPRGILVLNVKPVDSIIKIDGKKSGQGKIGLSPGEHQLIIARSGFADATLKFNINNKQTLTKNFGLHPTSQEGYDWIKKHPGDILQGEAFGPDRANEIDQTLKNYPIIGYLPYHSGIYNIDYGSSGDNDLTVQISASGPIGRQVALARIRSWGFDPTDYKIVFTNFSNPFSAKTQNNGAN